MQKKADLNRLQDIIEKIESGKPLTKEEGIYGKIISKLKTIKKKEYKINDDTRFALKIRLLGEYDNLFGKKP
jgi:hypothetical protein